MNRRQLLQFTGASLAAALSASCSGTEKVASAGVPLSRFGAESTADEVTSGLDLSGRLAVVTGCSSGIGLETMRVLAARGAHVIGTSRSLDRAAAAGESVTGTTTPLALELGTPESVVECAERILSFGKPVDMLICNAGVRGGGNERRLVNGIERHFAINHLGHFLLVNHLLENLFTANQARIVVVASRTAYKDAPAAGIEFDNLDASLHYDDATAYGQSKLANVLFAYELGKRLSGTRITANSLHPGLIDTDIDRNLGALTRFGFRVLASAVGKSVAEGAATSCYVATSPLLAGVSGKYFEDCNAVTVVGNPHFGNDALAERLWTVSAGLLAPYIADPGAREISAGGQHPQKGLGG